MAVPAVSCPTVMRPATLMLNSVVVPFCTTKASSEETVLEDKIETKPEEATKNLSCPWDCSCNILPIPVWLAKTDAKEVVGPMLFISPIII